MQNSYETITDMNSNQNNEATIIKTDEGAKDGQNKCPRCGATEISLNVSTGKLKCRYCRCEFDPVKINEANNNINDLKGQVLGSGAQDIVADTKDILTFKCSSCGAEVIIDTASSLQARCHWCRNTLSVNQQIPNGSVPDMVLPFKLSKDEARDEIKKFVKKRQFFANPKFKEEFTTENIMGVYLPYMVVDINAHASLKGQGEEQIRSYRRDDKTYYDAKVYDVMREFDLTVDDLTVESSSDRLNHTSSDKTNNVINAIMPFDVENCVKWDANYLKGYTSEKRDTNVSQLGSLVESQAKDIAKYKANESLKQYDRGVRWDNEQINIKGQMWKTAYLPVWLYSYQQVSGNKKVLHYVAVNARSKETMGSVPIHMPKLLLFSFIVEIFGIMLSLLTLDSDSEFGWIFALSGIAFYLFFFAKYRNHNARHKHEAETRSTISNLSKYDNFVTTRKGLRNSRMNGANNSSFGGNNFGNIINSIEKINDIADINIKIK